MLKREVHIFLTAIMFFTRIPCPKWIDHNPEYLSKSSKYFSFVGIIVGGIGAFVYYISSFVLPDEIAVILSMVATVYTTGAFHEDGFADVCDGLGGGWTKEKIMFIMKDSRIGTYGAVGLGMLLATKFLALTYISPVFIPLTIISGHSLSRFVATTLIYTHPYVRDDESSKAKPAAKNIDLKTVAVSAAFGIIPLFFFPTPWAFMAIIPTYLSKIYLGQKFTKWLGGHTGDCAGAVQQLAEVVFYLSLLMIWKFI
ncbi:adenosylcobinamide-GDP ribazoletransferase [Zhouia spongiae]|uniref:Adenosylcobinamide-GDP ribazoletransferase n=1 Tax=Zhouia spongiae TaxID=2202721 RepID=A0ABY3YII1_9FLAO|nr:adenosylcobinamide-GDP ribazoletransferase [Zhouia spongiae]UNY97677.1 adenosylcobinamide-GDP ribazoletransferase [Zhouia spongiae]